MTAKNDDDKNNNKGAETKPLTSFAPPPTSAILSTAGFIATAVWTFPTLDDDHPPNYDTNIFTRRVFPELVSLKTLLAVRLFFTTIGVLGFAMAWMFPPITLRTPYRPKSMVARVPFVLNGWKKQWPFTAWSWNVLTIGFGLSSYITYMEFFHPNHRVDPWLVRLALLVWEISAPMTLLIGAVVKYALWPAQLKEHGQGGGFLTPRALLQHNANVVMAAVEVALLGGLPVKFQHISFSVLYGCSYILFTWAVQMQWRDGQGPSFLYFFMDTTLGMEHTLALYVLLATLMAFHSLFCGIESLLAHTGNSVLGHGLFTIALCAFVCRIRD